MYLHRLDLEAIGPYPGRVSIDFAALGANGVFLLEGPTGSGKSTIIDAVVFALYGGLAGEESSRDRLHSQHADARVEPFVELVFETGAGIYRVRRTPQYDRPKQRGKGTVRQQSSARLFRLGAPDDRAGAPVSDRAQEVGLEVTRIVGLDRSQFLQTVVLPQGEFARFLHAPGEDRHTLLQSLFGTAVYDRITDELVARRRTAEASVREAEVAVRDALGRFEQASGRSDLTVDDVDIVTATLRSEAAATEAVRVAARSAFVDAQQAVADAERRDRALDRRADLLMRRTRLEADAAKVEQAKVRLASAERAARVTGLLDGLDAARERLASLREERDVLRASSDVPAELGGAEKLRSIAEGLRGVVTAVAHLVEVERSLAARRRSLADSAEEVRRLRATLAGSTATIDSLPDVRADLVERHRIASEAAADGERAERQRVDAERLLALLDEHRVAVDAEESAAIRLREASSSASAALAEETGLRARRIAGLAGELGAALAPGQPCPVCGATEHPHVAVAADDHPDVEAIARAERARSAADAEQASAAAAHAVAQSTLARLTEATAGTERAGVGDALDAALRRIALARAAAEEASALSEQIAGHDDRARVLSAERAETASRLAVAEANVLAEEDRIASEEALVAAAHADAAGAGAVGGTLEEATDSLTARVEALERCATVDERVLAAERDVGEREKEVARVADTQGFGAPESARTAILPADEGDRLTAVVTDAARERAIIDAGLAEPEVIEAETDSREAVDVSGRRAALSDAEAAADAAATRAMSAAERATSAEACRSLVAAAIAERESVSERSRAVVRMADVASAVPQQNPKGITLGTFVLMRRFEDVVAAANDRLRWMFAGRFALETSDERERGARTRRTGLALAIRDHTTDSARDPRSLSGGETFTISLCLALGLTDIVQAESGGVELGTLFVDEGFGTLDPETLDDIVDQLTKLTAGGRRVGIVSHVDELKRRIPDRIEVRRLASGGSTVSVTG